MILDIFELISGLGVFLLGVRALNSELFCASKARATAALAKYSSRPLSGVLTGAAATAAMQSSSALTALVVGLVNAGALTLLEASYLIMGANIGTTLSGLIVAAQGLEISALFPLAAPIGLIMGGLVKKPALKTASNILCALGLMFAGLGLMKASAQDLIDGSPLSLLVAKNSSFLLLIIIGCLAAAVAQSSSAINGILITLVNTGAAPISSAIYIILGTNIGSCATTMLSSGGMSRAARQAALIHLFFNLFGTISFALVLAPIPADSLNSFLSRLGTSAGGQLAVFNLFQNIITALLVLPFIKKLTNAILAKQEA